jgi:tRNA uridine 5-carboxymethylaminomethyl modification enzyme
LYKAAIRNILERQENLYIFQQAADDLIVEGETVTGVVSNMGVRFHAQTVVLTTGTFLGGVIHIGMENHSGGRAGDPPSIALARRLRELPLRVDRLKTGTPPRIDARTVDFSVMEEQPGDQPTPVMSYIGRADQHPQQISCYITKTNERTHDIIRSGFDRSPMFTGKIEGVGPRYCPSIEDKINRFADKNSHQIFVEPEGLNTIELYPNGISTSLPFDIQLAAVQSIKGFENAHITRPGYAIEYDFFNPQDLKHSFENKYIHNLYFAGQINGTTGYEEAGAQGLLAGINAGLRAKGLDPWYPTRDEAYIGVLADDLITLGTKEPYRMFTSRAEYRLLLREDNADLRLTETGRKLGVVDDIRWQAFCQKREMLEREKNRLDSTWIQPDSEQASRANKYLEKPLSREYCLSDLLRRPELTIENIAEITNISVQDPLVAQQLEIQVKYEGYITRQQEEIDRLKKFENTLLPIDFDYSTISGLSKELQQKLQQQCPETIAQASRIQGMTPAAISLLLIYLKKRDLLKKKSA